MDRESLKSGDKMSNKHEFEIGQIVLIDGEMGKIIGREIYFDEPDYLCQLDDETKTIIGNMSGYSAGWVRAKHIKAVSNE